MNFAIDDEVHVLAGAIGELLNREDGRRWSALCELGVPALMLPEPDGAGMDLLDATVFAERLGQELLPEPAVSSVALALGWHRHGGEEAILGDLLNNGFTAAFDAFGAVSIDTRDGLAGRVDVAADERIDVLAVLAASAEADQSALVLVDLAGVDRDVRSSTADVLRPTVSTELAHLTPRAVCHLGAGAATRLRHELTILLSAELVGGMTRVVTDTVRYVTDRQQFGRSVGSFQAIKHQLADMYAATEQARAAVQFAAISATSALESGSADVSSVARWVPRAAITVCETAIHLHGAMGFSWEVNLHWHLRRALLVRQQFGRAAR